MFRQSGRSDVEQILRESQPYLNGADRAIEIGCGVGRLTLPMAERFAEVIGVDIAPSMIHKLAEYSREAGVPNVRGFLSEEAWWKQGTADLVYSLIVFQHIDREPVIAEYFRRIATCLSPTGVCYAQFDTRARTAAYYGLRMLPDALLPTPWRKGIRRVRRRPADLRNLLDSCGLAVVEELRPNTDWHAFLLQLR